MIPRTKNFANAQLAAIGAGATVCAAQFLLLTGGLTGAGASFGTVLWFGLLVFLIAWLIAAIGFGIGLLLIGVPAWAGLNRLGWMSQGAAMVSGAVLAALVGGLPGLMGAGLGGGLQSAAFMLLPGALAGWTLHHVAYGSKPV